MRTSWRSCTSNASAGPPASSGSRGAARIGPSPDCPFDHLVVEYEIELEAAGGHSYSPDPAYWSATPPRFPPVAGNDEGKGLTAAIVVSGDVPPEAKLDRPAQPRP